MTVYPISDIGKFANEIFVNKLTEVEFDPLVTEIAYLLRFTNMERTKFINFVIYIE
jgi:hypothetical protein